jgi:hypothetical protein
VTIGSCVDRNRACRGPAVTRYPYRSDVLAQTDAGTQLTLVGIQHSRDGRRQLSASDPPIFGYTWPSVRYSPAAVDTAVHPKMLLRGPRNFWHALRICSRARRSGRSGRSGSGGRTGRNGKAERHSAVIARHGVPKQSRRSIAEPLETAAGLLRGLRPLAMTCRLTAGPPDRLTA